MAEEFAADTIGVRLARIAGLLPDKVAIVEGGAQIDYRRLDAAASAIARRIGIVGAGRSGVVCLLFANKIPAIAAIFGAARSGHTYVPLDGGDPEERLRFILRDCEPIALLTEGPLIVRARSLAPPGCTVVDVGHAERGFESRALPEVAADSLVYLSYTSGSTGQPKGVGQTHRNLLFFVDAYAKTLRIVEADRVSLLYTLSFSASNMDIFGGLLNGATVCAYDLRRDAIRHVAGWLDRERITVLHAVPTVFREFAAGLAPERRFPHLRAIDLGGESVFEGDVQLFRQHTLEHCFLVNHLAATEASVIAQYVVEHGSVAFSGAMIPVGRCPQRVRVDIRREDGSLAARNEVGELIVSSPHVSPGYWRRPELDAAAFSVDPQSPGWRCYCTGDLGRIDEVGNLHFLGRKGGRVKIRGHSVDLTEIEAALSTCPGVTKAAVLVTGAERQAEPDRLVAYVATEQDRHRDPLAIRRRLAAHVPSYMLPTGFVFLDTLPLTASGKIDRKALALVQPMPADPNREFDLPRDDVERTVAGIFQQLLNVQPIGRDDDFFLLGGDSLAVVELQARLRDSFGVSQSNFHEDATVAAIAANIRRNEGPPSTTPRSLPVLMPLWRDGSAPPLFLIHGRHGQAFVSPHFMRLLGNDQPVWVFQARGLDGLREPHSTIEAMAAEYVAEMRKERPRGPYFLGALCAGALIAAVMARSLREAGEEVLPLLLLDPPDHALQGGYLQMSEQAFVGKMRARAAKGSIVGPVEDPEYMKAVVRTVTAFEHAIASHRPRPYDGPVFMLSSKQRLSGPDPMYLNGIFTGRLERYEVATTHANVLDPRNPVFAGYLARCLGSIRGAVQADAPTSSRAFLLER